MPLVKNGKILGDAFVHLADDAEIPGDGAILISSTRFLADPETLSRRAGKTGVIWPNNRDVDDLVPYLDRLAVIDLADRKAKDDIPNKVSRWIDLPCVAYASAPTPDGKWLLVACMATHQLLVIDMATLTIAKTFDLPQSPSEILVTPDGAIAFISCVSAGKIAVLDLRAWQLKEPIVLTAGVDGLAWVPANLSR